MKSDFVMTGKLCRFSQRAPSSGRKDAGTVIPPLVEKMEARQMLSASAIAYTPSQVRHAYGFDQVSFTDRSGKKPTG